MDPDRIYCPIRREWVSALPEERVRQRILQHMINDCGFPAPLIAVEKALRQLPHLSTSDRCSIPDRRADIICFAKGIHPTQESLYPLLTVECKAIKLTPKVINQVVGYNYFIRAHFIVIVNQTELRTGWYDSNLETYKFVNYLPAFQDLNSLLNKTHD